MNSQPFSTNQSVPLASVLSTEQLKIRPSRAPALAEENEALLELARALANAPRAILQRLVDAALRLCHADSAGVSIQESENGQPIFRWHALAGALSSHFRGNNPETF